jgi:hypothetical protein
MKIGTYSGGMEDSRPPEVTGEGDREGTVEFSVKTATTTYFIEASQDELAEFVTELQGAWHKAFLDSDRPQTYHQCTRCAHFVLYETLDEQWTHLDNGEQLLAYLGGDPEDLNEKYDHDAVPGEIHTLDRWKLLRPELFVEDKEGRVGPNSPDFADRRGWSK